MTTYENLVGGYQNYVMLELARRSSGDTPGGDTSEHMNNRIGLLCTSLDIQTNKQSLAFPIPFSGVIAGESTTLALDAGLATKTISLQGIILDQWVKKQTNKNDFSAVKLSAHEIAQMIHSYVDSSFLHEDQNLTKLIVLYPSRTTKDFTQRTNGATLDTMQLPLVPFTWANRDTEIPTTEGGFKLAFGNTPFPDEINLVTTIDGESTTEKEIPGVTGFINDFSTNLSGDEFPAISFSLTFTNASTAMSDFINAGF